MNRIVRMVLGNLFYVPGAWIKLCRYAKHQERYTYEEMYAHIAEVLRRAVRASNVTVEVTGLVNIPAQGGFMLYGNHQGMFDALAVGATCPLPLACVMKQELKDLPLLKQVIRCTGSYPMDREDVRQSLTVIRSVTREVQEEGRRFLIFPEGTRSKQGNTMGEFHGGSFRCALKAKCPIVPLCFIDCFKPLDEKGSKPVTVQLHYLPVITYEEYQGMNTVELAALVKSRIQECMDAHTDEKK